MTTAEWTADVVNILLIVLIIAVFVAGIIAIRKFITERFIAKWNIWSASVFGFLFMAYLVLHVLADLNLLANWDVLSDLREILPEDWGQIFLVLGLVVATGFYALMAFRQAKASAKMAEETREQRYSESLPLLVPTIPDILPSEKLFYEAIASGVGVKVIWCNVGKGVAINSRFSFWTAPTSPGKAHFFPPRESETLEVGGKKEVDYSKILNDGQLCDIQKGYPPHLLAEYQDIYERKITTVQEFRIEEQNDYKRVLLGDLYFTINGRRLGQEAIRHD